MNDCMHGERLSDHLDGHLTREEQASLRRHLESGPACGCSEELAGLTALTRSLERLRPGSVPGGGWERLEAALEGTARQGRYPALLPWAAMVILGGALFAWTLPLPSGPTPDGRPVLGDDLTSRRPGLAGGVGASGDGDPAHRPRFLAAVARVDLPPLHISDDLAIRYGTEIATLDSLLKLARAAPDDPPGDVLLARDLERLVSLREDLLAELVFQAQAERTATWQ